MRFYFMRHGESVANSEGWLAGATDTPLTETSQAQARDAQSIVNNLPVSKIYHSSLYRAHETAFGNFFKALSECLSLQTGIQNAHNCSVIEIYNDHGAWDAVDVC